MKPAPIQATEDGVRLQIHLVPGAAAAQFPVGVDPWRGALTARVKSPPVAGRANEELLALVADFFSIPLARVRLERGATARTKQIHVEGIRVEDATQRIERYLHGSTA